jgi:hypothetical protein
MIKAAEKVYDCLHRERYRYMLGSAVDDRLLAQYADTSAFRVSVYDARHLLPQSRVTFQVQPQEPSGSITSRSPICAVPGWRPPGPRRRRYWRA